MYTCMLIIHVTYTGLSSYPGLSSWRRAYTRTTLGSAGMYDAYYMNYTCTIYYIHIILHTYSICTHLVGVCIIIIVCTTRIVCVLSWVYIWTEVYMYYLFTYYILYILHTYSICICNYITIYMYMYTCTILSYYYIRLWHICMYIICIIL